VDAVLVVFVVVADGDYSGRGQGRVPNPSAMVRGEESSAAPNARPWSDGTSCVQMPPFALLARLAAIVGLLVDATLS
jgi:hypothetical protein